MSNTAIVIPSSLCSSFYGNVGNNIPSYHITQKGENKVNLLSFWGGESNILPILLSERHNKSSDLYGFSGSNVTFPICISGGRVV